MRALGGEANDMNPDPRFLKAAERWKRDRPPADVDTTREGILALVREGESETVEFKTRLPSDEILAQNLVAFANTRGGVLIIGVGDGGEVIGVAEADVGSTMERLGTVASRLLPYPVQVGTVEIDGRSIVFAALRPAPPEVGPVTTSRGQYFARQGTAAVFGDLDYAWFQKQPPSMPASKRRVQAFVAMSFREEEEPALVDYFAAMQRAVTATGLPIDLVRMDLEEGDYEISQKIVDRIEEADIVIADFTLNSSNVYFELGYARGCRCRVIQTARKGTQLEFDIRNWRTVFYRNATELERKLAPALTEAYASVEGSGGPATESSTTSG